MSSTFSGPVPFIELQQVESTNNYAIGLVHAGMAQHGLAVFAHHQTAGKGQRHKQWQSDAGKNIALTLILRPESLVLSQSFLVSMAIAVGAFRFFSRYAGDETKIKWPNDIYWRDRKAGGILIENTIHGSDWRWCVAGIGLNINQTSFAGITAKATSLKQITGKEQDPLLLAQELLQFLKDAYDELISSPQTIIREYKTHLYKCGEAVLLKQGARTFTATVKDVTPYGRLITESSLEESFAVGEIEWLI